MNEDTQRTAQTALEILLGMDPPETKTARVKLRGLSEAAGCEVVFTVRALSYDRVRAIQRMESGDEGNFALAVILAGVSAPDLRAPELLAKYHAPTPYELIPKLLSAGEIDELAMRIENLSGYRRQVTEMVDEIKKK